MADNVAATCMNGVERAKEAFKNMIKDKNKWLNKVISNINYNFHSLVINLVCKK